MKPTTKRAVKRKAAARSDDFRRGAEAAAGVAADYSSSTTHEYRLDDCILFKLNLRDGKPKKNLRRLQDPKEAWVAGFVVALAEVHRYNGDGYSVRMAAKAAGITFAAAKAAKVSAFDLKELKRAGVK